MIKYLSIASNYLNNRTKAVMAIVAIFYTVGVFGTLAPPTSSLFLSLTPYVLLLSTLLLIAFHKGNDTGKTILSFLIIYMLSFIIEVIGVKTGLIFGDYAYGEGLGIKLFQTPLIIGLNWFFLVYTTASIVEDFKIPGWLKIVGASLLMVFYDVILEQLAPMLDMWDWKDGVIPFQNYVAWFLLAFLFHWFLKLRNIKFKNRLAFVILFCQFMFFVVLLIANKLIS